MAVAEPKPVDLDKIINDQLETTLTRLLIRLGEEAEFNAKNFLRNRNQKEVLLGLLAKNSGRVEQVASNTLIFVFRRVTVDFEDLNEVVNYFKLNYPGAKITVSNGFYIVIRVVAAAPMNHS